VAVGSGVTGPVGAATAAAKRLLTDRLALVAAEPEHLIAELEAPERLALLLGASVGPDWPPGEYDRDAQAFFLARLIEGGPEVCGWFCWYALRPAHGEQPAVAVGAGGYCGPPDDNGEVEIGFSILPAQRGQGYATELAQALVGRAFVEPQVGAVVAHAGAENGPSRKVLEKCGFVCIGRDDESGNDRFLLTRDQGGSGRGGCSPK